MLIGMLVTAAIAVILPAVKLEKVVSWMITFSDIFSFIAIGSFLEK